MANKEEQLKVIYDKIARKDLSFGCRVEATSITRRRGYNKGEEKNGQTIKGIFIPKPTGYDTIYNNVKQYDVVDSFVRSGNYKEIKRTITRIIGHPVMIGDVLDWFQYKYICLEHGIIPKAQYDSEEHVYRCMEKHGEHGTSKVCEGNEDIIRVWSKLNQPIENQSDECIEYIYKLCV